MKENYPSNITDEKLDKLARTIARSAILTDAEVEEIAAAPILWRKTQNRLAAEKARREKHRFFGWHWQWASVAAFAILVASVAGFLYFRQTNLEIAVAPEKINPVSPTFSKDETAVFQSKSESPNQAVLLAEQPKTSLIEDKTITPQSKIIRARSSSTAKFSAPDAAKIKSVRQKETQAAEKTEKKTAAETATEFIALSYLPATESGQIVRLKVPRSMMVSLGVTTKTEKNSELVNAEVVLGDDGAARAIRFLADE